MIEKINLKKQAKKLKYKGTSDPIFLSLKQRNEYIGNVLGYVKMLSLGARVDLAKLILSKQDIISLSNPTNTERGDESTKKKDKFLLKLIKPTLDKLDTLGLDFLRIHIRDMVYNLGDELRDKMLFKRFELRLTEKFKTFQNSLSHVFEYVTVELDEFLEKNEIHMHFKNLSEQRLDHSDHVHNKHIILNTKNKIVTVSHINKAKQMVAQTFHSLEDNNFLYYIYDMLLDMENRLNPALKSQSVI